MVQQSPARAAPRVRSEESPKWVRARLGSTTVVDSRRARIVSVGPRPRTYAVPVEDLRSDLLVDDGEARDHPVFGRVRDAALDVDGRRVENAVRFFESGPGADAGLRDIAAVRWGAMDQWYEESDPVYVHPHDPHHRIDVHRSSRHVVIEVDGERVAESHRPTLLFETNLPVRYYVPHEDVRFDVLRESDTRTACPYKGFAGYYHVDVGGTRHEDLVWTYRAPFHEAFRVQGLLAFFDERVDVTVDGAKKERPHSPWDAKPGEVEARAADEWG